MKHLSSSSPSSAAMPARSDARTQGFRWRQLATPSVLYRWAGQHTRLLFIVAALCAAAGLWLGFLVAPTDHQQGEVYRLIFLHVPAAWMSMLLYLAAALHAGLGLVYRSRSSPLMARALAPTGAMFTVIALWTGAVWGKPTWGTWWVWDARLTSELVLLFLYLGYMALTEAIEDPRRADTAGAVLLLTGVINIPLIYFSVQWWSTLHQGASIRFDAAPSMTRTMLAALLLMTLACWAYAAATVLVRVRSLIRQRAEQEDRHWLRAEATLEMSS